MSSPKSARRPDLVGVRRRSLWFDALWASPNPPGGGGQPSGGPGLFLWVSVASVPSGSSSASVVIPRPWPKCLSQASDNVGAPRTGTPRCGWTTPTTSPCTRRSGAPCASRPCTGPTLTTSSTRPRVPRNRVDGSPGPRRRRRQLSRGSRAVQWSVVCPARHRGTGCRDAVVRDVLESPWGNYRPHQTRPARLRVGAPLVRVMGASAGRAGGIRSPHTTTDRERPPAGRQSRRGPDHTGRFDLPDG